MSHKDRKRISSIEIIVFLVTFLIGVVSVSTFRISAYSQINNNGDDHTINRIAHQIATANHDISEESTKEYLWR